MNRALNLAFSKNCRKIFLQCQPFPEISTIVIMNVCQQTQSLASGLDVHGAADDCARLARMVTQSIHNIINSYKQPRLMRELGCRPSQRAKAIHCTTRVGHRRGGSANRRKAVTSVISCPARVFSPGNSQTGHVGISPRQAIQTDRVAPGGERWRSTHPPPWLFPNAGWRRMSRT